MSVHFKWFDLWVGVFVERNDPDYRTILYICPLPMLVLRIALGALAASNQDTEPPR